jgi:hypothetical protein
MNLQGRRTKSYKLMYTKISKSLHILVTFMYLM